ncbi:MAG TPA: ABC-F family ATP-binding cassette domain-containing protein [Gemmatimonadaceae bacterium]|nr:ABC-F family ATP-binding cassette domain-containing protein [Gemmatimonadaceae bacterium]
MTILSLSGVRVDFGATTILQDVTFTVAEGERWGIVGRNGAGKTTLFRLITGALAPTAGAVARRPALRIALLDQHRDFGEAVSVWEAAAHAYRDVIALERSLHAQGERMAALGDALPPADLERYGHDQERFAHLGGYEYHARVDTVLQGLGFDPALAHARPLASLSGGERGRLGLAAQLAAPADLVLLDEPTNHLDLETTEWLKEFLRTYDGTVLMISHDRAFLDDTVDHVLHVSARGATSYRGGYSSFVVQRAERQLALERQVAQQRAFIAKEEEYIRRNIAGQNTAQAKGRRTRLARLPRLSPPPGEGDAMSIRLEAEARGGDQALVAEHLTVRVGERTLVRDFSAVVRRGDVIALVGANGAGKSTLLATLLGERAPAAGSARVGGSVAVEWFRQDLAQVPADRAIYDCIADLRPLWTRGRIQNHLGCFSFSGDEVMRSTATLSGGERARVALALLTLRKANLLVLDEPTNHLDVESIEALEDAVEEYEGTVIVVSHDRAFLRELATRVWSLEGERIEDFDGPFVEWEARVKERAGRRRAEQSAQESAARERTRAAARKAAAGKEDGASARRAARRSAEEAEAEAQALDARVAGLERALADPSLYDGGAAGAKRAAALNAELKQAMKEHEAAFLRWSAAVEKLSGLET